jgi:hypothetical protein
MTGLGYWLGLSVHQQWVVMGFLEPIGFESLSLFSRQAVDALSTESSSTEDEPPKKQLKKEAAPIAPATAAAVAVVGATPAAAGAPVFRLDRQNLLDYYHYYNPGMAKMVDMVLTQESPHQHLAQMMQDK